MHLADLEVWSWRGLEHVAVGPFSERLNLIYGCNEAGKSRLFQALEFVLFESYKGRAQYKQELQGWSSSESPRGAVTFVLDGDRYRVEKRFLKGGYARLEGGGRTLKDEEAEAELRRLLGSRPGSSRSIDRGDYGLWPLLWLPQGSSRRAPHDDLGDEPRGELQDRLASEVGELAAGPRGQRVLERAREEAARYWTGRAGKPTGELAAAQAAVATAQAARDEAVTARDEAHAAADELARRRAESADLERRIAERRIELEAARGAVEAARKAERAAAEQESEVEKRRLRLEQAEERLRGRRDLETRRVQAASELERLDADLDGVDGELAAAAEKAKAADAAAETAEDELERAQRRLAAARAVRRRAELAEQLEAVEAELGELSRRRDRVRDLEARGERLTIDFEAVAGLEELERRLEMARGRLEGGAARLSLEARVDLPLSGEGFAGTELAAGETRSWPVTERLELEIGEVARLVVEPGAGEGRALVHRLRDLESELRRELAALGVDDVAAARARRDELREIESELAVQRGGPEEESLARRLESAEKRRSRLRAELRASSELADEDGEGPAPELAADPLSAADAESRAASAETALRRARAEREAASRRLEELRLRRAELAGGRRQLRTDLERVETALAERPEETLEALLASEREENARLGEALRMLDERRRAYAAAGGDEAKRTLGRLERSLDGLEEEERRCRDAVVRLQVQLERLSDADLYERAQESEQVLAREQARLARVEARAAAAKLLLETLERERRAAQQRLTAPVRERLAPYLVELFPGSDLDLDEEWKVKGLVTGDLAEGFEQLSGGAQEQLSVLVRVALGEIFAGDGRLPLILDDALVNSDAGRRAALMRVLDRASRRLQVLVFTCHDEHFDALGAEARFRIEGGR